MTRYARAPSSELVELLMPGGFLAPLLAPRQLAGQPLDVHFREDDHVQVYCGLTRVLDAQRSRRGIEMTADAAYTAQPCAQGLFRLWSRTEHGFGEAVAHYLEHVVVADTWHAGEGSVQAAWSSMRQPWICFDREVVLGYASRSEGTAARTFEALARAHADLGAAYAARSWRLPKRAGSPRKVDRLAIDPVGRLVLAELKDSAADDVEFAPLQLLQYVHEWSVAYDSARPGLDAVCNARLAVGLSPPSTPHLTEGIRPVIGFGEDRRRPEVRARFDVVLEIASRHLPPSVLPLEAWSVSGGTATRVSPPASLPAGTREDVFVAPPRENDWNTLVAYAHQGRSKTFDGYAHSDGFLHVAASDLANTRLAEYVKTARWRGTFEELRVCLFFEARRWRHFGADPANEELRQLQSLVERLRELARSEFPHDSG